MTALLSDLVKPVQDTDHDKNGVHPASNNRIYMKIVICQVVLVYIDKSRVMSLYVLG